MENCISMINKDHFLVYEELMKNYILLSKGMTGRAIEMGASGRTYMGAHSLLRSPEIMTLVPLQAGAWWRHLVLPLPHQ